MKVLIFGNQIAGLAPIDQDPSTLPVGFTIAEYAGEVPIESLYFDNGELKLLPQITFITPYVPDWSGLLSDLTGSEVWAKSFVAASTSLPANAAWTILCGTLTGINRSVPTLMFAIGALRAAMVNTEDGDFTEAQVNTINEIMADRGFPAI